MSVYVYLSSTYYIESSFYPFYYTYLDKTNYVMRNIEFKEESTTVQTGVNSILDLELTFNSNSGIEWEFII